MDKIVVEEWRVRGFVKEVKRTRRKPYRMKEVPIPSMTGSCRLRHHLLQRQKMTQSE